MAARVSYTRRFVYIVSGVISMLFAGIIYAWSILKMPLGEEFGWSPSQLALNFTLTMCCFCLGGIVAGMLLRRSTSPKIIMLIAALLSCSGFFLASGLSGQIMQLYVYYGIMCGLGIGMAYNVIITVTSAWFPDKKGTCSGALMMGFGASALVLGNLAGSMMEAPSLGWRRTYMILGIAMGIALLLEGLVIRFPPPDTEFPKVAAGRGGSLNQGFTPRDFTTREMLQRPTFWRFFLFSISIASVGNTVISFAKDFTLSVGAGGALATTLVGVLSICNGLGRILSGATFDLLGRKRTMLLANGVTIAAVAVCLLSVVTGSLPVCILGLCLIGLSYGSSPTMSAAFVSSFYGTKYFAMNFSIANTMLVPASFVATLSAGLASSTGSYVAPFLMLLVFSLIGLGLNLSIKQP